MANVSIGVPNPSSATFAGGVPDNFGITDWEIIEQTPTLLVYRGPAPLPPVGPPDTASAPKFYLTIANGIVTGVRYEASYINGTIPKFQATGLNIPLATFQANLGNVIPLVLAGNDTIDGNDFDNVLKGLAGNDTIYGHGGNDILVGGTGLDKLYGGTGNDILAPQFTTDPLDREIVDGGDGIDTISFVGEFSHSYQSMGFLTISLGGGYATGMTDSRQYISATLISIENAAGSKGQDQIIGSAVANTITGGAGNDNLYGEAGNDILRGDAGADLIDGGDGIDRADYTTSAVGVTVSLASGLGTASDGDRLLRIENLFGSAYNDALTGSQDANFLYGYSGDDQIYGLGGNDRINGQDGNDALFGGGDNDVVIGGSGNDGLFGETGNDVLYGGDGDDYLSGGDGGDVISGDSGHDQIDAGAGNDILLLGAGNDAFTLGAGADRVRVENGNGADTIRDFGNGNDVLDFRATAVTLAFLQANTVQTEAGILIGLTGGSILLEGLTLSQIDWNTDFVFAT